MIRERFFKAFALFTILFTVYAGAFSQGTTTRITGVVTDSNGAVVSGATVNVQRADTGIVLTAQTADNGTYVFDLLQPGIYEVTVQKQGFRKVISTGNVVYVNQPGTVNVVLEAGDVSATVSVVGTVEQVQTSTSGNIGVTIEQKAIEALPIFGQRGRNPLDILNGLPGVSTDITNEAGGGVHVHGSRDRAFNFTLDGIDINESSFGGSNFTPLRTNPDSLQEMQVVTNNATAEIGRSSGANVSFVTRSGTNEFHGTLFELYQTPGLYANEYQNNLNGRPRPKFIQHIFGGSLGGPLFDPGFGEGRSPGWLRNKAFFFVNVQMLRAQEGRTVTRTVLTQSMRDGIFRYRQGALNAPAGTATASVDANGTPLFAACTLATQTNCINSYSILANSVADGGLDPALMALQRAMPLPNSFSAGGDGLNTGAFVWSAPMSERQRDIAAKFDFKINDSNMFYVRYATGFQNTIADNGNGGSPSFPGYIRKVDTRREPKNLAVNYRWSPSPRFTNEFITGFNNYIFSFDNPDPNWATNPPFIFNLVTDPFSNAGFINNNRRIKVYQFVDNVTMDFSPHTLKMGTNIRFNQEIDYRTSVASALTTLQVSLTSQGANGNPIPASYNLTAQTPGIQSADSTRLQQLINDTVGRYGRVLRAFVADESGGAFAPAGTPWTYTAKYPEYNFYVQDTWKVRRNLTLDLGVRYEINLHPSSDTKPILTPAQSVVIGAPASTSLSWIEGPLFKTDRNNFGPSLGFAWDPFGTGKTSIRGNYRRSFDRLNTFVFASSIYQNAPGYTVAVSNLTGGLLRNGLPVLSPPATPLAARNPPAFSTNAITTLDPALQTPTVDQWSLSFQRELWAKIVLEVNYIQNRGNHLFGGYDSNQANILGSDSRCPGQNFLQAFTELRAAVAAGTGTTSNICLLNYLMNGNNSTNAAGGGIGTQAFRTNTTISPTLSAEATGGGVGLAAQTVSRLTTAGVQSIIGRGFPATFFQRYPQFSGGLLVLDTNDISRYKGVEIILSRRITNGLGFNASYTWSISKDSRSFDPTQTTVGGGAGQSAGSTPYDIANRLGNYSWSDFDRRHAIRGNYIWELPFGRGRRFGSDMPRLLDWLAGGWRLAGTVNVTSGRPFTVYSGVNTFSNVVQATANCNGCSRDDGRLIQESGTNFWFDSATRAKFSTPAPGSLGNTPRNFFIGPSLFQMDASLSKKFSITERVNFELRADAKNITNSISFTAPTNISTSTTFGRIRDAVYTSTFARKIQIGARLNF